MSQAPEPIQDLVARFERNIDSYRNQGYNETQLRREFLDPFFEALGWDVANKAGHAEPYKDVIHEAQVKIGGTTKAPDYCFRIGGARKFFLEAKKPSISIKDEPSPAYQLRRYAWSGKLPLSILTDFEEFAAYDCRTRPSEKDKPSAGRTLYLTYKDYLTRWDEIASIFSKNAVLKGSFDKYAVKERKKGTATVDAAFLAEIEGWREALAKNLALRNRKLSVHELNFAVQRTIDRLVFLRICEDRGVEHYGQLQALLNGENVYGRMKQLFRQADDRYNSGLFHFQRETSRAEAPDELTLDLKVDDKVLKDLLKRLYYPDSPYEFSVFPAEILGQVYEQFLGKVIRLTSGHQAKVEEKPEVRKAGGVYYTPAYIVEYIVKQTVGKLCESKTPKQIAKLRILDPACGSGSFLIGAYEYLLTYHRDWYVKDGPEKYRKELYKTAAGEWRLTSQEKKRILLNNIYGVDIDPQAVEVTKLSLLLKVLEGESDETLKRQLSFVQERALPDLGKNIKCGNSLIGPDYFTGQLLPDDEAMRRINPFDWKSEFPDIFSPSSGKVTPLSSPSPSKGAAQYRSSPLRGEGEGGGGFDAVIGNPPYGAHLYGADKVYLVSKYSCQTYQLDSYLLFMERATRDLLAEAGFYGMIIPNPWLTNLLQNKIRRFVTEETRICEIVHFYFPVFPEVTVDTEIVILQNTDPSNWKASVTLVESLEAFLTVPAGAGVRRFSHEQQKWRSSNGDVINIFLTLGEESLARKCFVKGDLLAELYFINVGIKPYQVGKGTPSQTREVVARRPYDSDRRLDKSYRRYLRGSDIGRYKVAPEKPRYLKYGPWLAEPRPAANFDAPLKIVMRQTGDSLVATIDTQQYLCLNNMHVLVPMKTQPAPAYVLGILNSRLMNWYYHTLNPEMGEALAEVKKTNVANLPIRPINFSEAADKAKHDQMVALVERMLDLHKRLYDANAPDDKTRLQRQIDATDQEIDRRVYGLYGLAEEEIRIVEEAAVASSSVVRENKDHENETGSAHGPGQGRRAAQGMAEEARHTGESRSGAPKGAAAAGGRVDVVRERTGEYGASQEPPEEPEEGAEQVGSTRYFETAEGTLTFTQLAERLAVSLVTVLEQITSTPPDQTIITPEWLCLQHKALAGALFPDWAGRFRDVNVQVGSHTPPPFYEVPIHVRTFCDDLAERLRHSVGAAVGAAAEILAWADWRFQWIHPFKDLNGRIGRVMLAALLYKLSLPHVETAPTEPEARRQYLEALRAADTGSLDRLKELWEVRVVEAL